MTRNVVLIVLDTVRKDYFDAYAPRLQEAANASFDRCYAPSSWTIPSHASMLTGELPHQHDVHTYNKRFDGIDLADTFLADLADHRLLAVTANGNANELTNFDSFFDTFVDEFVSKRAFLPGGINLNRFSADTDGLRKYPKFLWEAVKQGKVIPSVVNGGFVKLDDIGITPSVERRVDYGANAVIDMSLEITTGEEPFFLYTNFMEAHLPLQPVAAYDEALYNVPASWTSDDVDSWDLVTADNPDEYAEYLTNLRELYRTSIDYLDRRITAFIQRLHETTNRETTIIVTSDHGEMLGFQREDGLLAHNIGGVADPLVHVPCLIMNPPAEINTGGLTSLLDIGQMCTAVTRGEPVDICQETVAAERIGLPSWEERAREHDERWPRAERCVYNGLRKYVWDSDGGFAEYRVGNKPSRETRVADPTYVAEDEFRTLFDEGIEGYKQQITGERSGWHDSIDDVDRQRLRDLGYL